MALCLTFKRGQHFEIIVPGQVQPLIVKVASIMPSGVLLQMTGPKEIGIRRSNAKTKVKRAEVA